ncbi:hypothetical protein IW261DRAFT_1561756 [Armillaria novae-zelandiae]|uniref:Uncharacterized protein n=1 Tax=Armillaria novae-zelandiae TaxID=153914 RepID=A0AA39ULQ5_9AGAR|nr:hypothetical protein IW261DRAFT_1561756 [Armillaria novae-zelandiae]
MFLSVGQVNAAALIADNAVDACNGSNDYGVGHSCAFKQSQGGVHRCVDGGHERDTALTFIAIRGAVCQSQSPLTTFYFTHGNRDEEDLIALEEVKLLDVDPKALAVNILILVR